MAQRWQKGFDHTLTSEAFVYLWYDAPNKKYYLGSHKGSVQDWYCHSSSKMQRFTRDCIPKGYRRRILCVGSHNHCFFKERDWLKSRRLPNQKYYNCYATQPTTKGYRHSADTIRKISLGISRALKGRKKSPQHLTALSKALKGHNALKGEQHGRAKLTALQVKLIKQLPRPVRAHTRLDLAEQFGVSQSMIEKIVYGKNWNHI
ncbi:MAG: hypothetical protein CBC91_07505 [Rickettsiales bacterium TMED131]|nr:MAG: hypothetical protein CBC91_07505 [Rickettsiales bacterium TMED131]|tara:strand:+ start:246 stop:857 length:612 start_codon:yes stop_codon:yes gene_type:complete